MKPFDIEHAKQGAPVRLSDGTEQVRIICWDRKGGNPPILALVGENEIAWCFHADGRIHNGRANGVKLVMAPIGIVDGRDVYFGDTLMLGSQEVEVNVNPLPPLFYRWPRKYPETQMIGASLITAAATLSGGHASDMYRAVANAAIAHGIDNGYLCEPIKEPTDDELFSAYCLPAKPPAHMNPHDREATLADLRRVWNLNRK